MEWDEFAEWGKEISDWGAEYHKSIRTRPVRAQTAPGSIAAQLPDRPPEDGEDMAKILDDFDKIINFMSRNYNLI